MSPYKNKEADREWHRNYMRKKRNVTPDTVSVTPSDEILDLVLTLAVTPENKGKRLAKAIGVLAAVSSPIKSAVRDDSSPVKEEARAIVPWHSGVKYKPGTELVLPSGKIITAPEIDADGNEIW